MDTTSIDRISRIERLEKNQQSIEKKPNRNKAFETLFQSALSMINETNEYSDRAKEASMSYAVGDLDNPVELMSAQAKATFSLQYTVAVRNAVLDAYKEIMQIQF